MADLSHAAKGQPERPLSPHLQIYRLIPNMVMSILHRITGAALYFGTLLLAWWLVAAATNESYFNYVSSWFGTWYGKVVLLAYTFALLLHMMGGIRHFIWDTGRGYDLKTIDQLSWGSAIVSVILTAVIWMLASQTAGGA
jgi:succinate dehydrogenase / fumarate reductase, cytochrome b subunit